ncbi:CPBP family intramembrane glutamic endopeptidase [Butyrivibrio sp. VCD2006]|uniref:CPBP family intramembrane glutamic endopeptidase n=1 Tax=Butyrivibrio sp. VCD2006 TaxID=1280664 RepID=UPI00041403BE|nr:type II CAAX endopeptidase family protein [Butyrivibrio sp. VCD2006]
MDTLQKKRIAVVMLFYMINFGLWELVAPVITPEWASFAVYVLLFIIVTLMFWDEMRSEWNEFKAGVFTGKGFKLSLAATLVIELLLSGAVIFIASKWCPIIMPENNENVKSQMAAVPVFLSVFQGCVFAPVIEEMTFRYGIINKPESKKSLIKLALISIVLFDVFHIARFPEFFYYLVPSVVLTLFYSKYRNVFASIVLHSLINVVGYAALLTGIL